MLARHARVLDHQVAIHLAAYGIRSVIQRQRLLIVPLHEDRDGKDARYARMRRSRHLSLNPLLNSLAAIMPATWHGPHCILRRAGVSRCSISPLIIMDQHQASHTQRYLEFRPERERPALLDSLSRQNEGKTRQRSTRYPRPEDQAGGDHEEGAVGDASLPNRSALLYQHH